MTYRFSALITKEDGWYVARCPELNVTSQGKMLRALVPTSAKPSSFTSKHGASLKKGQPKARRSGRPSKSRIDMSKLPSVSGERVVRALKGAGFSELRQKGSHVSLEKRTVDQVFKTVVPVHSQLAKGTLADILKQCGLKLEEFL
jgi:predicted RNA binding protein YcfA (HicA-like mRNA interferase family)